MVELTTSELFDPDALLALSRLTAAAGVLSIYLEEWRLGELRPLERIEPDVVEAPHERPGPVGSSPSDRTRSTAGALTAGTCSA